MAGSNLPAQLGPWQSAGAGTVATSYAETNLDGLALSDPVMRAIKQDGFYLTRSGVTDIVTLDKVASTDDRRIKDAIPDYAQWLPILRNQLKDMDFSRIRHVLAFVVTNGLMH